MSEGEVLFRFENMGIWQRGAGLSRPLFTLADQLDQRHCHRFAEQLRAATLSITNNIAEGSGSVSDADFANFLNISRRSVFEVANILIILSREGPLSAAEVHPLLLQLAEQSRMTLAFMRNLKT